MARRGAEPGPRRPTVGDSPAAPGSHVGFLAPAIVLAVLVYGRAPGTFFAQDDITFLSRAAGLEVSSGFFRLLSQGLGFRAEYAVFGLDPRGYHAVNLGLHLLNVVLVYALSARLGGSRAAAGAAAALFAVSAIAFTPLHWAAGISELLTASLLLGATLLWLGAARRSAGWRWGAALLALAAMCSKETAATWVLVVALLEWRSPRRGHDLGHEDARHEAGRASVEPTSVLHLREPELGEQDRKRDGVGCVERRQGERPEPVHPEQVAVDAEGPDRLRGRREEGVDLEPFLGNA